MATTQYTGARYVPVFAEPAEWNDTRTYEPLTIVLHEGNSYTSAQYVPMGIDISNEKFWKLTGNYNSQVEQYRKEVATYDGRITANADAITANADAITTEKNRAVAAEKVNADAIANIGSDVDFFDPSYGIVQNSSKSFVNPFYQSSAGLNSMTREDILKQLFIINEYYKAALDGDLIYSNTKTFHFIKDPDNENNYTPFDVTANLVDGKMGIDCATFTQLVAHTIRYSLSPYKKNYYFTSSFGSPYTYLQKNVVKYWEKNLDKTAGRLLTWQWAKFLADCGLLQILPAHLLQGSEEDLYTCNEKYIGSYIVQPGDHLFFRRAENNGRFLSIGHCAIVFDCYYDYTDKKSHVLVIDSASTTITPHGIDIREISENEISRICAIYRPSLGYGYQFYKYKRSTTLTKTEGTKTLTINYPVEIALHSNSTSTSRVTVKNINTAGDTIYEHPSTEIYTNGVYTFFAMPGTLEMTVISGDDTVNYDVEISNY